MLALKAVVSKYLLWNVGILLGRLQIREEYNAGAMVTRDHVVTCYGTTETLKNITRKEVIEKGVLLDVTLKKYSRVSTKVKKVHYTVWRKYLVRM